MTVADNDTITFIILWLCIWNTVMLLRLMWWLQFKKDSE